MYNGIGLQTARGSGTNGYVQTNKFFVRPRTGGKPVNGGKGFEDDQGTAGLSKKPNKAILDHDRKRQIHLKLAILEDKLADQGYSDAEIAQKLEEARVNLEAAAAANEETDTPGDSKISETQTHQIAARKEKQMEAFRAALGLPDQQQAEEGIIEDEPTGEAYEGRLKERRGHSFLDRDSGRKRDEDVSEKDGKDKESKKLREDDDDMDEVKRHKKKDSKKRRHGDSSDESDEHGRDRRRRSKKKARGRKQESDSESDSSSSESESDSDSDDGKKRRRKATKKRSRSRRSVSSGSEEVESDDNKKLRKSHKKSRPSNRSGSKEVRDRLEERNRAGRKRHDSDDSEPESEDNKQLRKKEEAYRGGQKQKIDDEDEECSPLKGRHRGDSVGKKAARDSDDSETEYVNTKRLRSKVEAYSAGMSQKRIEEEAGPNHGKDKYRSDSRGKRVASDSDSEAEYENRRKLKDGSNEKGRRHINEDEDYSNNGRDRYRNDDAVKRRGTIKEDDDYSKHKMDRYRGRGIEGEDNDKGDDDRDNRYRPRYEMAEDDEYYKRSRDRYRGDKDDRFRGEAAGERSSGKRSSYGDRD